MSEALVTGIVGITVCLISNIFQNRKTRTIIEYKIDTLEKAVEKHNKVIERTYELEKLEHLQEEQIKVINHRIADLEKR